MIPSYREVESQVGAALQEQGGLGVIVVDLVHLARIERSFGGTAYLALRAQIDPIFKEVKDHFRDDDVLTRDEREADRYLFFLTGVRPTGFAVGSMRKLCDRLEEQLTPRIARLTLPYFRERPTVEVGYGFVLWSPLESDERQLLRLIDEGLESAGLRRRLRERAQRETLIEIIHNRSLWTAFQSIVELDERQVMGYEGLSRGPRGSELEYPLALFGTAGRYGLIEELERACRRQCFVDWEHFARGGRLFV